MDHAIAIDTAEADHQRRSGDNLLHLLSLPADSRVLIVGKPLEGWREKFRGSCFQATVGADQQFGGMYDMALYHSACASSPREFRAHLKQLRSHTVMNGSLMIFAENFYSFHNLKRLRDGGLKEVLGKVRSGPAGFRRAIKTGFRFQQEFIPIPVVADPEEMIAAGSPLLEVSHHMHPLLRLAHRCGCLTAVADGNIFFCTPERLEEGTLLRSVTAKLASIGIPGRGLSLGRVDLRLRGAMVLFIREQTSGRHYIVRVVADPGAREIIRRNQEFLNGLRNLAGLPAGLKSLIPAPLCDLAQGDATLFIETMLPGVLAWKANKGRLKERIYRESVNFLMGLNRASRARVRLGETELYRLFSDDLRRLESCPDAEPVLQEEVRAIAGRLCRRLHGRSVFLAPAHGDYGYGNILVDPHSGRLTGVIDWDTGRLNELAGLDFLNLEIQKARIENDWGLFPAFTAVSKAVIARGGLDLAGGYREEFGIEGELVPLFLAIALVRYLSRAAQYPEVFSSEQGDYLRALDHLKVMLEAIE